VDSQSITRRLPVIGFSMDFARSICFTTDRSRCADFGVHQGDLGVQDAAIWAFTMIRFPHISKEFGGVHPLQSRSRLPEI